MKIAAQRNSRTALSSIFLAFMLGSFAGCNGPSFDTYVSPRPEIEAGGKLQIGVRVRNLSGGHLFRWTALHGKCEPQESTSLSTEYTAPLDATDDRITLEVRKNDKTVYGDDVFVKVIPSGMADGSGFPPSPQPSQTQSVTPSGPDITGKPEIRITLVPRYDPIGGDPTSEPIEGEVAGVNPQSFRVVIYSYTDRHYVQPLIAAPFTTISQDLKFRNWTHTGTLYSAILVRRTFTPPSKTWSLPEVGGDVVAVTSVTGRKK